MHILSTYSEDGRMLQIRDNRMYVNRDIKQYETREIGTFTENGKNSEGVTKDEAIALANTISNMFGITYDGEVVCTGSEQFYLPIYVGDGNTVEFITEPVWFIRSTNELQENKIVIYDAVTGEKLDDWKEK